VGGIFYGIVHRRTLQAREDKRREEQEVKKIEHWVDEAKKAWAKQKLQSVTPQKGRELLRALLPFSFLFLFFFLFGKTVLICLSPSFFFSDNGS
jgi:Flp pilus assembly protein TadB